MLPVLDEEHRYESICTKRLHCRRFLLGIRRQVEDARKLCWKLHTPHRTEKILVRLGAIQDILCKFNRLFMPDQYNLSTPYRHFTMHFIKYRRLEMQFCITNISVISDLILKYVDTCVKKNPLDHLTRIASKVSRLLQSCYSKSLFQEETS